MVDPAFEAGSIAVADWPLCQVRLQDDGRFVWLILIPRRIGMIELDDLSLEDRALLLDEVVLAGQRVRAMGLAMDRLVQKLNIATIGNITAQLHVHVVGRRLDDGLWPDPVWGRGQATPLTPELRDCLAEIVRHSPQ